MGCPRHCHTKKTCAWGNWAESGKCSVTCGKGLKKTVREVTAVSAGTPDAWTVSEDAECSGTEVKFKECDLPSCSQCKPQDCMFGAWSPWRGCDDRGDGCDCLRRRTRDVKQENNECGSPCVGTVSETDSCPTCGCRSDCEMS